MRKTSQLPRKRARATTALAAVGALIAAMGLLLMSSAAATADSEGKVYVCKYVGTPGESELVQTGQNPIEVSVNAIPTYDANNPLKDEAAELIGDSFTDAQEGSIVIAVSAGPGGGQGDEPTIEDCPGGGETQDECPELEGDQPEGFLCVMPDEVLEVPGEDLTCDAYTETMTTTTTSYTFVPGEGGGSWAANEPVVDVSSSTRKPTVAEIESLGELCIAGEEVLVPKDKPGKKPTVAGVEAVAPAAAAPAAAPTAVSAGIGSPASSPLQLVSQMLVAGGMLLLMAGAWIGLGRRESGTHEA